MNSEIIQRYLAGDLKGPELKDLIEKLKIDSALQRELELQQGMISMIEENGEVDSSIQAIKEVAQEFKADRPEKGIGISSVWKWLIILIIALMGSMILYNILKPDVSREQLLFAEYLEVPMASFGTKGEDVDSLLQKAELNFNKGNFELALEQFEMLYAEDLPNKGEILFYRALSKVELGNYYFATLDYEELRDNFPIFVEDANWYLSLLYVRTGELDRAISELENLQTGNYSTRAQKLLKKLKK